MYTYRFELSDGTSMFYKTQGMFTNKSQDDADKLLIKCAIIVNEEDVEDEVAVVAPSELSDDSDEAISGDVVSADNDADASSNVDDQA